MNYKNTYPLNTFKGETLRELLTFLTGRLGEEKKIEGIREYLTWGWGEKCPDYEEGCPTCEAYEGFDEYLKVVKSKNHVNRKTNNTRPR